MLQLAAATIRVALSNDSNLMLQVADQYAYYNSLDSADGRN